MTNFRQIVPIFAARFSGDLAEAEAPGDYSCKHQEIAQDAVYLIRNVLRSWLLFNALLALELYTTKLKVGPVCPYFIT